MAIRSLVGSILAAKSPKDQVPRVEDWSHSSTSSSSVWEILREGREDSDVRATNTWSHSDGLRVGQENPKPWSIMWSGLISDRVAALRPATADLTTGFRHRPSALVESVHERVSPAGQCRL